MTLFIVFSDNCENVIEFLLKQGSVSIWWSVNTTDDNVFPLGDNDFDKDRLNYFWISKFSFLKNFVLNIVLEINANSTAYF